MPRAEWLALRERVLQRDQYRCKGCGRGRPTVQLQVAHIIAKQRGGNDSMANLRTLCLECHQREHPWMFRYQQRNAGDLASVAEFAQTKKLLHRTIRRCC